MTKMTVFSLTLVALTAAAARADGPPRQLADLDKLVGTWKGTGKLTLGKDVAKVDIRIDCKKTPGDGGLACQLHGTGFPGLPAYEESDLFGFEPNTNLFHWYAVTNAGEVHDHVAKAFGSASDWVYEGTMDGKP